jgi:hypothetical protein
LGIGFKAKEAHDRLRARQSLGELETDAKGSQEYFALKRRVPGTKDVPVERYAVAAQEVKRLPLRSTTQRSSTTKSSLFAGTPAVNTDWENNTVISGLSSWQALGPYNVPGRSRALVFSPSNPNVMYTAGVAGGVWKSIDHGESWTSVGDAMGNIAVTSLAIDPTNSNIIYAGTGEGFGNFDAVRGLGIFKSTDGGANWIPSTTYMSYVNDIVVSSQNATIVFAATNDGIYRSTDGGASFLLIYSGRFTDLVMRTDSDVLFAAMGTESRSNIFRSVNASSISPTFDAVLSQSALNYQWGRISLAVAPSNQNVVYALVASVDPSREGSLEAVFRSNNGGSLGSWVTTVDYSSPVKLNRLLLSNVLAANAALCGAGPDFLYGQGWYDNVITVDPTNPERVWAGGTDLFRSDDGGKNWKLASYWWADHNDPSYTHADDHAIVFDPQYNGTTNRQIWVTNDGGVFRSNEALAATSTNACSPSASGFQWQRKSAGIATTQFYGGAVYADGLSYFGGTQDNGTVKGSDAVGANAWQEVLGGDGGKAAIDPTNPVIIYAEHPYLDIQRSMDGGASWTPITRTLQDYGFFVTPFVLDPSQPQRLWTGGIYVWRSDDRGTTWQRAGVVTPGEGYLTAVAVSPVNPNNVVAGLSDGYLVSTNMGLDANANTQWVISKPRNGFVSSITFDPVDAKTVYVTYSSFNEFFNSSHIYKSTDLGVTWLPLDGAGDYKIPDIPVNSLVVDPFIPTHLYIGTDIGVFVSLDGGLNWNRENTGFGNVVAESLVVNRNGSVANLFAFTHGRGVYRTILRDLGIVVTPSVLDFGDFPTGHTSTPRMLTVSNPSGAPVTIANVTAPAGFAIDSNSCATLQPGDSCTIGVTMSPMTEGTLSGTVLIAHDGTNSPYAIDVRGRGVNSAFIVVDKTSIDLGTTTAFAQGAVAEITVKNIGNQPAYSISVDWPSRTTVSTTCPYPGWLPVDASCKIYLRLYSETPGNSGTLTLQSIQPSQTITISTIGTVHPETFAITSITPSEVVMGAPTQGFKLLGAGLDPGMNLLVNGVSHSFQFQAATSTSQALVTLTLSASELAKPGTLTLVATNGLATTRPATIAITMPSGLTAFSYERFTRKVYGFVRESNDTKTFTRVDPDSGTAVALQNFPRTTVAGYDDDLAKPVATEDGRYLYFGVNGKVYRFNLRLNSIDTSFWLRTLDDGSQLCAIEVLPMRGNDDAVIVNEKSCLNRYSVGLMLYVNGVPTGTHSWSPSEGFHYDDAGDQIYTLDLPNVRVLNVNVVDGITLAQQQVVDYVLPEANFNLRNHAIYRLDGIYDAASFQRLNVFRRGAVVVNVRDTALSPDGRFALHLGEGIETYDTATLDQVAKYGDPNQSSVSQIDFIKNGHALFYLHETITTIRSSVMPLPGDERPTNELVPFINSISQVSVLQGSENLVLTIRGENFTAWSSARWNGTDRETKWIDSTTLKVFLPWTDFQNAGVNQVTIANAQGQSSGPASFAVVAPIPAGQSALLVSNFGEGIGVVSSSLGGISCGNNCLAVVPENTMITLTAAPGLRSAFVGWGGECSGVADCVVTTSGTKSVTATFQATQHLLELEKKGSGGGTVSANAGNLDCGSTCSAYIDVATTVSVLAVPAAGSDFVGWSGACSGTGSCEVTMKTANKVTASFQGALTLTLNMTGSGRVTGVDLDCSQTCSKNYAMDASVSLVATPSFGWSFQGWSGACTGTGACNVSMTAAKSVSAIFTFAASFGFVAPQNNSSTVQSGGSAQYAISIQRNPTTNETITLTASGLPPGAAFSFSPATLGPGVTSSTLTITTIKTVAQQRSVMPIEIWLALPVVAVMFAGRRRSWRLMMIAIVAIALSTPGCGGGGGSTSSPPPPPTTTSPSGTPVGTYTITITGTSPSTAKTMTVVLKVI